MIGTKGTMSKYRGLFAGFGVGLGFGVVLFILETFHFQRLKLRLLREIDELKNAVTSLQQDLAFIKKQDGVRNDGDAIAVPIRRRKRQALSESNAFTNVDMYSPTETDDADDEFFDFSSDGEDLMEISKRQNLENQRMSESTRALFSRVDTLLKSSREDQKEALQILLSNVGSLGDNVNFLWRLARAYQVQTSMTDDKEMRKELILKGLAFAKQAVEMNPSHGDANKWFAILTGMMNDYLATKEKIENGVLFQKHLEQALAAKPDDYSLYHLLARFKYEIANLSWIEKKLASALFGALPEVTIDDALGDAEKCRSLCSDIFPENEVLLARCHIAKGNYTQGITCLDNTAKASNGSPMNELLKKELEELQSKYGRYRV